MKKDALACLIHHSAGDGVITTSAWIFATEVSRDWDAHGRMGTR